MNLVDLYYKLEEKWFAFVDSLSEKGIPLDKIVDKLEQVGIPTFPLLITIILFGIYFSVLFFVPEQPVSPTTHYYTLTIQVTDQNGEPVKGALIIIGSKENYTGDTGEAMFRLEKGNYTVQISKSGCENTTKEVSVMENKIIPIILTCAKIIAPKTMDKTLILKTPDGTLIDSGYVYVYKKEKETPETYNIENGKVKIHLDEDVWKVEIVGENMRCTKTLYQDDLFGNESVLDITMECKEPVEETVTITVQVVDESDNPIKDIPVKIEDKEGRQITTTENTNDEGIVEFDGITKGIDVVIVAGPYGEYKENRVEINTGEKQEVRVVLTKAEKSTLTIITVLNESGSPVKYATIIIYKDNKTISKGSTNSEGVFKVSLDKGKKYKITVYKNGHYINDEITGGQNKTIILNMSKKITFGSLTVYVYLQLESGDLKTPKNTYVYLKDSNGARLPLEKEVRNGVVRFDELPVGTYIPVAVRNGVETSGESVEIQEGSRKTVKIYLQPLEFQLIVYVKKDSEPVPGAHVVLYQGTTQVSETTTEIDGAAYFFVKEQLDYTIEAEKEIEGAKYIGKEKINGYEITHDLEKTVELMSPDYDIIYKGVSEYPGGPFQKNKTLDIAKKYYLDFQITVPDKDERVELKLEEDDISVLSVHSDLEEMCEFEANKDQVIVKNCSGGDISDIKFYIEPKELGIAKPELIAEFYLKNELMKKKKIVVELNITTTCKVVDNKYICLKVNGTGVGVVTKPYNVTYELKTNYGKPIEYEHTCSEETGSISDEHGKITVTPVKTGTCYIIFKANDTEIIRHKYEVSPVSCKVELEPNSTYVNGETSIKITKVITTPQIDVKEVKVKNVNYPSDDYSGLTRGDMYSEGDSFKLISGKSSGKVRITWSINIPESNQEGICTPSEIDVTESPLKVLTKEIRTSTEKLMLKNSGKQTIRVSDVSLVYPEEGYEVSLNCYDEDIDEKVSPGENYTCKISEKILEKLNEYSQGETKKIWVFAEYEDLKSDKFTYKEQITFNVKLCEPKLEIVVSPTEETQGKDIEVKLVSAKFVNKFCEEEEVKVNLIECDPGLCTLGSYKAGDVVLKLNGSDTTGLDKVSLTFEYNETENTTEIMFIPANILQVKLSTYVITINKDNLVDPYNGEINVEITLESATFNGKEVEVTLQSNGRTGAAITNYKKGDKIVLTRLPVTDSTTLEWRYHDSKYKKWYFNTTTITFKVSGKLEVSVSPTEVDANKTSAELNVNATFEGVKTKVILENCIPKELCSAYLNNKVLLYPDKAKDYTYAYLRWRLEVPKDSQRVFKDETRIKILNSTCGEFVKLETTTLMENESNEYTIKITRKEDGTELNKCENATCTIDGDKLILKDVKSNEVYVEFKKDKCIAPFTIHILSKTKYFGELYSTIPRVVNTTILENIIKPDSPKEIAEKFNNGTTYRGEYYFNNQYFLAKLVAGILKKSDEVMQDVFKNDPDPEKCVEEGKYNLTEKFQSCDDLVLTTTLRNVTIGYVNMDNVSFYHLLNSTEGLLESTLYGSGSKLICGLKNITCPGNHYIIDINEESGVITCGVYDINIVLDCAEHVGSCSLKEIEFKKVKDASCNVSINNFPLFLGQTRIADPPEGSGVDCTELGLGLIELYTNFSKHIGRMYEKIIGMYDSCKRYKWNINDYLKIDKDNGMLTPSEKNPPVKIEKPHLIYIIPEEWIENGVPKGDSDNTGPYPDIVERTIDIYKQYCSDDSSLLIRMVNLTNEGVGIFLAGNISRLENLSALYKEGNLSDGVTFIDETTIVLGKAKERPESKEWTPGEILFRALTDCGDEKNYTITLSDKNDKFCWAECIATKAYSNSEECNEKCDGVCHVNLCYKGICKKEWENNNLELINYIINQNSGMIMTFSSINEFIYNGTYAGESTIFKNLFGGDKCDPGYEHIKLFVDPVCWGDKTKPCDISIKSKEPLELGKSYKISFKIKYTPSTLSPAVCEVRIEPI